MHDQPRYEAYESSSFHEDGRASRQHVEGTVPRGSYLGDAERYAGNYTGGASAGGQAPNSAAAAGQGAVREALGGGQPADARAPRPGVGRGIGEQGQNIAAPVGQGGQAGRPGGAGGDAFPFAITEAILARGQERFNISCAPCHSRVGDGNGMIVRRGFRRPPSFHDPRLRGMPAGHYYDVITNGIGAMASYSDQLSPRDRWAVVAYIRALQLSQNAAVADLSPEDRARLGAGGTR